MGTVRRIAILLLLTGAARAQELPDVPPMPPPLPPPPAYLPPPPTEEIESLEESGRAKRVTGDALLIAGGLLALTGIGLVIGGAWSDSSCSVRYDSHGHADDSSCGNGTIAFAGAMALFASITAIVPGSVLHDEGERDLASARAIRRGWCRSWCVGTGVNGHGALAEIGTRF